MRLDKFLKVSRLVKRRTVANEIANAGRVLVNDKVGKPGTKVEEGDILKISFGAEVTTVRITKIASSIRKEEASLMYEIL